MSPAPELLLHDLRAPLARAKTYGKLMAELNNLPGEAKELLTLLQNALEDLDRILREAAAQGSS